MLSKQPPASLSPSSAAGCTKVYKHWRHAQWNAPQWRHQFRQQQQRDFEDAHHRSRPGVGRVYAERKSSRQKNKSAEEVGSVAAGEAWMSRQERQPRVRCSSRDTTTTHTGDTAQRVRTSAHTGRKKSCAACGSCSAFVASAGPMEFGRFPQRRRCWGESHRVSRALSAPTWIFSRC